MRFSVRTTFPPIFIALLMLLLSACRPAVLAEHQPASTSTNTPVAVISTKDDILPTYTLAPVFEPPAPISAPKVTTRPTTTPQPAHTPTPTRHYPVEHHIKMIGHRQYFALGCETSAALDWAEYFDVFINEYNFQYGLGQSDNPDKGFVGDVNGPWGQIPPYAYGVNAGPVAAQLRKNGLPAQDYKNFSLERLKMEIASDEPVIAWVIGNVVGGVPTEYVDQEGDKVIVAAYEHVILVTGYNEETDRIRYLNNGKFYDVPTDVFLNSWGVLENMVVVKESSQ